MPVTFVVNKRTGTLEIMNYLFLSLAIIAEVIATTVLKASNGFTVLVPAVSALLIYGVSFYFMSLCMRTIPTGIVYAIWSGVGIVLISLAAYFVYKQSLDIPAIIGISMIVGGVIVIRVFSQAA